MINKDVLQNQLNSLKFEVIDIQPCPNKDTHEILMRINDTLIIGELSALEDEIFNENQIGRALSCFRNWRFLSDESYWTQQKFFNSRMDQILKND